MNERIQELYKEAVDLASAELHEWNKNWQPGNHTNFEYEKVLYEKFAELLENEFEAKYFSEGYVQGRSDGTMETARECAELCFNRAYNSTRGSFSDGALLCGSDIKQHFGVEE